MTRSGLELPTDTILLSVENIDKSPYGFTTGEACNRDDGHYAKSLASAYLKFTEKGKQLSVGDSVQQFIQLADLHRDLTEEVRQFLKQEIQFIYEDQPIQALLVHFAAFRLQQMSRRYYYASLQNHQADELAALKASIMACQAEYDQLMQHS